MPLPWKRPREAAGADTVRTDGPRSLARAACVVALAGLAACSAEADQATVAEAEGEASNEALSTAPSAASPVASDRTRTLTCPVLDPRKSARASFRGKPYVYRTDSESQPRSPGWESRVALDSHALDGLVPASDRAVVIDIRRVEGKPAYAYFGAHGLVHETYEPWSSAKIMAASAAMARVRGQSDARVGGPASAGPSAIGDLITAMESYATSGNVPGASNEIAGYFLTVAGAERTNALFGASWLNLTGDASGFHLSTVAGRSRSAWGAAPYPAGRTWSMADGASATVTLDTQMVDDKPVSALAQAEWLKRLSQHVLAPEASMPGFQAADLDVLFYGKPGSSKVGGMLAGVSAYVANALAGTTALGPAETVARIDALNGGRSNWRVFDKVGWGDSSTRSRSEVVLVSYTCLPEYDGGHELVIALRTSVPRSSVDAAGKVAQATMSKLVDEALKVRATD